MFTTSNVLSDDNDSIFADHDPAYEKMLSQRRRHPHEYNINDGALVHPPTLPRVDVDVLAERGRDSPSSFGSVEVMRLFVIGDWGGPGHQPQRDVARAMTDRWQRMRRQWPSCQSVVRSAKEDNNEKRNPGRAVPFSPLFYVVSTGDNMYEDGVASIKDKKFQRNFEKVYTTTTEVDAATGLRPPPMLLDGQVGDGGRAATFPGDLTGVHGGDASHGGDAGSFIATVQTVGYSTDSADSELEGGKLSEFTLPISLLSSGVSAVPFRETVNATTRRRPPPDRCAFEAIPWMLVLGNHDHGAHGTFRDVMAQVNYSRLSPRWFMPSTYFHQSFRVNFASVEEHDGEGAALEGRVAPSSAPAVTRNDVMHVDIIFLDSYDITPYASHMTPHQLRWLRRTLRRIADRDRDAEEKQQPSTTTTTATNVKSHRRCRIAVGHRPMVSVGTKHADSPFFQKALLPLFHAFNVSVFLSGDDHNLQVIREEERVRNESGNHPHDHDHDTGGGGGVLHVVSGAGARAKNAFKTQVLGPSHWQAMRRRRGRHGQKGGTDDGGDSWWAHWEPSLQFVSGKHGFVDVALRLDGTILGTVVHADGTEAFQFHHPC